jgi:hypothetical protein
MRTDYSYIGSGRLLARKRGEEGPYRELGNVSALTLGVEQETKRLRDFRAPGGGTYNQVDRITGVTLAVTAHDLSPENIALALYGTTAAVAATPVVDEAHAVYPGGYFITDTPLNADVAPVVTNMAGAVTYTAGTDYVVQQVRRHPGAEPDWRRLRGPGNDRRRAGRRLQAGRNFPVFPRLRGRRHLIAAPVTWTAGPPL